MTLPSFFLEPSLMGLRVSQLPGHQPEDPDLVLSGEPRVPEWGMGALLLTE
jgi:hypothetical protein